MTISSGEGRLDEVRTLFREYQASLGIDLCFQGFETEMASLPGLYAAPQGGLFLASQEGGLLGCVAFKPLSDRICELKRLYIRPDGRGQGAGRALCEHVLAEAGQRGYDTIRLDTLARLSGALCLYRSLGFVEIPPYHDTLPEEPLVFMERKLRV